MRTTMRDLRIDEIGRVAGGGFGSAGAGIGGAGAGASGLSGGATLSGMTCSQVPALVGPISGAYFISKSETRMVCY